MQRTKGPHAKTPRRKARSVKENDVARDVVDAALAIHRTLGPGLLESVYERILEHELKKRGLKVARQVPIEVVYDGLVFDEGFRADLIVEALVVIELKSIEVLAPVHGKQLLTYLKLTGNASDFSSISEMSFSRTVLNELSMGSTTLATLTRLCVFA